MCLIISNQIIKNQIVVPRINILVLGNYILVPRKYIIFLGINQNRNYNKNRQKILLKFRKNFAQYTEDLDKHLIKKIKSIKD